MKNSFAVIWTVITTGAAAFIIGTWPGSYPIILAAACIACFGYGRMSAYHDRKSEKR